MKPFNIFVILVVMWATWSCVDVPEFGPLNPCDPDYAGDEVCPADLLDAGGGGGAIDGGGGDSGGGAEGDTGGNGDSLCLDDDGHILANWCFVDGSCHQAGVWEPTAHCQLCDPAASAHSWTNRPDETPCTITGGAGDTTAGSCTNGLCIPVGCECGEKSTCCDGCNPANVGLECFQDELSCTTYLCTDEGACEQEVREGWCLVDGACIDSNSSVTNCGACGHDCEEGMVCSHGQCSISCDNGLTDCDGACADLTASDTHCGFCGNGCPAGSTCSLGQCLVQVTGVTVSPATISLAKGDTRQLTATVQPANAADQSVTWISSQPVVATVNSAGLVTATGVGQTTITSTTVNGGHTASSLITVHVAVSGVIVEPAILTMMPGEVAQLEAIIEPADATNRGVAWASSDLNVATVDSTGKVSASSSGTAIISATAADGNHRGECEVVVEAVSVTGITVTPPAISLKKGQVMVLEANIQPPDATDKRISWASSAPHVVSVDNTGLINCLQGGQATITATTASGGHQATCQVTVKVPVSSVVIEPTSMLLAPGETAQLQATVLPEDADNKAVTWESSAPDKASVDSDGMVTALEPGEATITVITADGGHTATALIEVSIPVTGVSVEPQALLLMPGDTATITATIQPPEATNRHVTWTSHNPGVASVNQAGLVTAVAAGQTTITARADGGFWAPVTVEVGVPATGITIEPERLILLVSYTSTLTATVSPTDATDKTVTWASSQAEVATVDDNGMVEGLSDGTVIITATAGEGQVSAAATVRVMTMPEDFVYIPAGSFIMGSPGPECPGPECIDPRCQTEAGCPVEEVGRYSWETQHPVTLTNPFLMQASEVTQAQWQSLMGNNPSNHTRCDQCPVEMVSWWDTLAYANALSLREGLEPCYTVQCTGSPGTANYNCADVTVNAPEQNPYLCEGYRLPTAAEWQYAGRAGVYGPYNDGSDSPHNVGWTFPFANSETHPVKLKQPNNWGLYDMHGNVWEWTWNKYHSSLMQGKMSEKQVNPIGYNGDDKTYRFMMGGYFGGPVRIAYSYLQSPTELFKAFGFRLVITTNSYSSHNTCGSRRP